MPGSIHDNHVLGYSVDHAARALVIRTEDRTDGAAVERLDIRFEGVLGYHLRDSLGGILDGVYPTTMARLVSEWRELFAAWENEAWPFQGCDGDVAAFVEAAGASAFDVRSAIGFDGFVVCRSFAVVPGAVRG